MGIISSTKRYHAAGSFSGVRIGKWLKIGEKYRGKIGEPAMFKLAFWPLMNNVNEH
jgi:hypothetical protein